MLRPRRFWFVTLVTFLLITCSGVLKKVVALSLCTLLGFESFTCPIALLRDTRTLAATPPSPLIAPLIAQDIFGGDGNNSSPPPQNDIFQPPASPDSSTPLPNINSPSPETDLFNDPDESTSSPSLVEGSSRSENEISPSGIALNPPFTDVSFRSINEDDFELYLNNSEGCNITVQVEINNDQISRETIQLNHEDSTICGVEPFTASILIEEKRFEYQVNTSSERLVYEILNPQSLRVTHQAPSGESRTKVIPIPTDLQALLIEDSQVASINEYGELEETLATKIFANLSRNKVAGREICEGFNKICDYINIFGGMMALANTTVGLLAIATGGAAFGVGLGVEIALYTANWLCFAAFGGIPPIFPPGFAPGATTVLRGAAQGTQWGLEYAQGSLAFSNQLYNRYHGNESGKPSYCGGGLGFDWSDQNIPTFIRNVRNLLPFSDCDRHCEDEPTETGEFTPRDGNLKQGTSYGDPHIISYDGYRYSFQTLGEYILTKSVSGDFEVQTRQTQVSGSQLSLNTAAALRVGNNRVAFYAQFFPDSATDTSLRINGEPTYLGDGESLNLPGGGTIHHQSGNDYQVELPSGEYVTIHEIHVGGMEFMNVTPNVYSNPPGQFVGLLGDLDGDPANDLRTRGGDVIPSRSTYGEVRQVVTSFVPIPGIIPLNRLEDAVFNQIYKDFGNSWRVDSAESLFDYAPGEGPATFADPNFPSSYRSLENLTPDQMQEAEAICLEAGVEPELLEGCVFDVAFTEEAGFAQAAANALLDEVGDRVLDEIQRRAPIPIPRLPF